HTRWPRDWSSDVCSSDLGNGPRGDVAEPALVRAAGLRRRALGRRAPGAGRARRGVRGRGAACRVRVVLMAAGRRGAPEPLRAARSEERRVGKEWGAWLVV